MSPDAPSSIRHLRVVLLIAAMILVAVLAVVFVRSLRPDWRGFQEKFRITAKTERSPGISEVLTCTGEVDRCRSCHLGMERLDLAGSQVPLPFRAHPAVLGPHRLDQIGCSACHGGSGRSLEPAAAHARPGSTEMDPLLRAPNIEAGCARCHVPGDGPGTERLVRGASLFLNLGCIMCHPLTRSGRGGWDFGPDLRSIGRRSLKYLQTNLTDPTANFAQSTMPSFAETFENDRESLTDLTIFLESLVLPRASSCSLRSRSDALLAQPCASCHAGPAGLAGGRFQHRCVYIRERQEELSCRGCHGGGLPAPGSSQNRCPVISEHRAACAACHDELPGRSEP